MCEVKKLTLADVEITIGIEPEQDVPVEGNVQCSDDPELDRESEQWVLNQLRKGNVRAWCSVVVVAKWNGFEGRDYLGAVSCETCKDLDDLIAAHEMQANALADLQRVLEETHAKLCA